MDCTWFWRVCWDGLWTLSLGLSQFRGHWRLAHLWSGPNKRSDLPIRRFASPPLSRHNTRSNKRRVHLIYYLTPLRTDPLANGLKSRPDGSHCHIRPGTAPFSGTSNARFMGPAPEEGSVETDVNLDKTSQMSFTFPQVLYVAWWPRNWWGNGDTLVLIIGGLTSRLAS